MSLIMQLIVKIEITVVNQNIKHNLHRMPTVKQYDGIGYNDNSNLEGMRIVPPSKSGPPKPPSRQR